MKVRHKYHSIYVCVSGDDLGSKVGVKTLCVSFSNLSQDQK